MSKTEELSVWVVVLHWLQQLHTRACLESLEHLTYPKFNILLVNNGSPDNSGEVLAKLFPKVSYLNLPRNLGFAGGGNAAMQYCIDKKADWIWLLNNDTKVSPDSLSLLMNQAMQNDKAAALGAIACEASHVCPVSSGIGEIDFHHAKTFMKKQPPAGVEAVSCEWLSGCNLLLKAAALSEIQGFDEDYFLYFEDTDLCLRLRKLGWQCLLVPQARIEHIGGASTEGALSIWRSYYHTRNRLLFFSRHIKGIRALPAFLYIYGHLLRHCLVLPFRGIAGRRQLKAELLGLNDYLRNKFGQAICLNW